MKIQIMSDIHLCWFDYQPQIEPDVDLVVLAGDLWTGRKGAQWAIEHFKNVSNVVYVAGNHEFYTNAIPKTINDLYTLTKNTNVSFLENDLITIGNLNIYGCSLWINYELFDDKETSMNSCRLRLNDYKKIRISPQFRKFSPGDAVSLHKKSMLWLQVELSKRKQQKNIIVTHHAPSPRSLPTNERDDVIGAAYCSDLENFILRHNPDLWIHGHIHSSVDYYIGQTRIISNPRGNPHSRNLDFRDDLVIEI